jgi:hypothetical protein
LHGRIDDFAVNDFAFMSHLVEVDLELGIADSEAAASATASGI